MGIAEVDIFSARSLFRELEEEPNISLQQRARYFVAFAITRVPEGVPYLLPRSPDEADRGDSLCHGCGILIEHLVPALVSSGLLSVMRSKNDSSSSQLAFKKRAFEEFQTIFRNLDVQSLHRQIDGKKCVLIARGKLAPEYLSPGGAILTPTQAATRLPMSRDKLPAKALELATTIQASTLQEQTELCGILGITTQASNRRIDTGTNSSSPDGTNSGSPDSVSNGVAPAVVTPTSTVLTPMDTTTTVEELCNELMRVKIAASQACQMIAKNDNTEALRHLLLLSIDIPPGEDGGSWYKFHTEEVGEKHKVTVAVPNTYKAVLERNVKMWQHSHEEKKSMLKALTSGICSFPVSAKRHIAAAVAMSPKTSGASLEIILYATTVAILDKMGIEYTQEQVLNILPVKATLEEWTKDLAASVMFICASRLEEEEGVGAYLMTDKAEEKVKQGMIKIITKWSPSLANDEWPDGQLYICTLDSDGTGATTEEGAKGVQNSLEKLPNHETIYFWGFCADSGGGFVRERKKEALEQLDYCRVWALMANCCCHNMQLTGTVPMKHLFEKGGVGKRCLPQLLYLAHELQGSVLGRRLTRECMEQLKDTGIGIDENDIDNEFTNTGLTDAEGKKTDFLLVKPDDSRWLQTAVTCDRLERDLEMWDRLADACLESDQVKNTK